MKVRLVTLILFACSTSIFAQNGKERLNDLSIEFLLRGYFYAGSTIKDSRALGGFGPSENWPKPVTVEMKLPNGKVSLVAYPDEETVFLKKYKGLKLVLVNRTGKRQAFSASDSRLEIIQEALDKDGKWKPIEYLPSSWCGNSYHTVFLDQNEYWEFSAARFKGIQNTKLRFRLDLSTNKVEKYIYSNEFDGSINPKQFTEQKPYSPNGIMDPYDN